MAFPTGWTSYGIQTDPDKVSGSSNHTNFPVLISDSNLSSDVYAGLNPSIGYSIDLEASSSQYAYVADNAALSITGDITCEAWIKMEQLPSSFGDYFAITNKWDDLTGNNRSYLFSINTSNKLEFISSSDGLNQSGTNWNMGNNTVAFTSADVGKWIHVAVAVDTSASTMTFYKNGQAQTTTYVYQQASSIYDGSSAFIIGAKGAGGGTTSDYFDGKLSNVRIWSDIRTATEILENRHATLTGTTDNLVGSWYNQDNDSNDNAGTNNLTTSGSPTIGTDTPLGGSDLRITTDSAGTTEVPFEIVSLDTVAETCEIWAKVPTLSYNSATELYIWYGNSSALPYSATDTYGSQNVWTGDVVRYHLESSGNDSSANLYNLTATNSPVYATGKIGNGVDLESTSSQYLSIADASCANLEISGSQTWSFWFKPESIALMNLIGKNGATNQHQLYLSSGGKVSSNFSGLSTAGLEHTTVLSAGTIYRVVFRYDGSATAIWINDSKESLAVTGTANDTNAPFYIGRDNSGTYGDGIFDDVRVSSSALTDDWITTEYNNQNSPSTFWSEIVTTITQTLTETVTITDTITKSSERTLSDAIAVVDNFARTLTLPRTYQEAITLVDTLIKAPTKVITNNITVSDVFAGEKAGQKIFSEVVMITDTINSVLGRTYSETVTITDTILKQAQKTFSETLSLLDNLIKDTTRTLSESLTIVDIFNSQIMYYRTLLETITITDLLETVFAKFFTETITLRDSLVNFLNGVKVSIWTRASKAAAVTWTRASKAAKVIWDRKGRP